MPFSSKTTVAALGQNLLFLSFAALSAAGCVTASDIRAQAASDFGCPHVEVDTMSLNNFEASGCGQTAQYFVNDGQIIGPIERPADSPAVIVQSVPPAPPPLREPPSGAGGFAFGASEDEARRACEQAKHTYTTDAGGRGSCDGVAADVGAPARAALTYCDGKVCAVSLAIAVAANDDLAHALVRWKDALVDKYGGPTSSHAHIPDSCDGDVTPCLRDKHGQIRFDWRWRAGQHIALTTGAGGGQKAWVEIGYSAPTSPPPKRPGL